MNKGRFPIHFRVTHISRSEHEGQPVSHSVMLQPVNTLPGNTYNSLTFSFDGELPEGVELGARFVLRRES